MKKEETKPLTTFEETLLWSSMRYFIGRGTISASCQANDIITNWYKRILATKGLAERFSNDIKSEYEMLSRWGNDISYKETWLKVAYLFDKSCHFEVETTLGTIETVFKFNDKLVPVKSYIETPYRDVYMNEEFLIKK